MTWGFENGTEGRLLIYWIIECF